jgi:hypothetical protein
LYATTGHGGDVELRRRDPTRFRFLLLRVFDPSTPTRDIDAAESHFKDALDSPPSRVEPKGDLLKKREDEGAHVPLVEVPCRAGEAVFEFHAFQPVFDQGCERAVGAHSGEPEWNSERSASFFFSARSAASLVVAVDWTSRPHPSQSL